MDETRELKEEKDLNIDSSNEDTLDKSNSKEDNELLSKLELQEQKTKEYLELSKKIQADFENYKKRVDKDILIYMFQKEKSILEEFVNFRNILNVAYEKETNENSKNNLKSLISSYDNILKRLNVTKLDCLNEDFDYNFCECVIRQNVDDEKKVNKVIEVLEDGYLLNKKLLKPAKVIVGIKEE